MGLVEAIVASAVLGVGSSVYSAQQQKKASQAASDAQQRAEMEARRIAAQKKPMEETATLKTNALDAGVDPVTSLNLLVDPMQRPKKTGLGTSMSSTGLGFGG